MSAGSLFWLAFVDALLACPAVDFRTLPGIRAGVGGLVPLDPRRTGYSGTEAPSFLAVLTLRARAPYRRSQRALDRAFPAFFAAAVIFAGRALTRAGFLVARVW